MTRHNPRRPSSGASASRPRRIAGHPVERPVERPVAEPEVVEPETETAGAEPDVLEPEPPDAEPEVVEPGAEPEPEPEPEPEERAASARDVLASPRTTRVLAAVVAVLAALALAGGVFLWVDDDDDQGGDDRAPVAAVDPDAPVQIADADAQAAVAAAASAAFTIVTNSWQDYDAEVAEAVELMTPRFQEEYRTTAEDVEAEIVRTKTEVQGTVVAQGVVSATTERVQALIFLNQLTTRDGEQPVYTPYRALVTVVNTDDGWLVDDLETQ